MSKPIVLKEYEQKNHSQTPLGKGDLEELQKYIRNKPEINKAELKKACSVVDGKIYVGDLELPKVGFIPKTSEFGIR